MSLFTTTPPRERPSPPSARKQLEVPLWVVAFGLFLVGWSFAFYIGRVYERHDFAAKVDRLYQIKSALGPDAAKRYLQDNP